jgi:hypothetical protein
MEHKLNHVKLHLYTCASKIPTTQKNIYEFMRKNSTTLVTNVDWWLNSKPLFIKQASIMQNNPNSHYYQSEVQFTSLNHYGTLKVK